MAGPADFEACIQAFEAAWRAGSPPSVQDYLQQTKSSDELSRRRLLVELICVDLEYRWRYSSAGIPIEGPKLLLEDYLRELPELGPLKSLPTELVAEEYRVRQRWGKTPDWEEYRRRFGTDRVELFTSLARVDAELAAEKPADAVSVQPSTSRPKIETHLSYTDYLLQQLVGAGGSGKVYRAIENFSGRTVAVKFLKKAFMADHEAVERFAFEAKIVASLQHPAIVRVEGLGSTLQGGYFIVMELVEGSDLAKRLQQGPVSVSDAIDWTVQVCQALEVAHSRQIVHCDIKPGNILLDGPNRVRLTDFGLAQSHTLESTGRGAIAGTIPFMAPEQISPVWGTVGPQTDVYGVGALLHTLLTGQPPLRARDAIDMLSEAVTATPLQDLRTLKPDIPEQLARICMRCLAKSPSQRFTTVGELRAQLQELIPP